jgi:hypothetical protein
MNRKNRSKGARKQGSGDKEIESDQAGFGANRDRQAIPGVDRGRRHHETYKLSIAERNGRLGLDAIRNVIDADESDGFGER